MPTVIDALIVTLGLDPSKFTQGHKETQEALDKTEKASRRVNRGIEDDAKKGAEAIRKLKQEVLGLVAAFIGFNALKGFTERITAADAATGRLAKNVSMNTDELSRWQGVADRAGGSADGMAGSIKNLVQQFERWGTQGVEGSAVPFFRALGIAISDTNGAMRPMNDILLDVSSKFQGMRASQAQAIGAGMGFDEGTVNVLLKGPDAVRAMLAEQAKLNQLSEADAKAAQDREKAWRETVQAATDLGRKLLTEVTPALTTIAEVLKEALVWLKSNKGVAEALLLSLGALGALKFAGLLSGLASVSGALGSAAGIAAGLVRTLGLIGLVGGGSYAIATALGADKLGEGIGGWLYDKINGPGPSMGGGGGGGGGGKGVPRGIRNNNPGNINFAGQPGATLEAGPGGRFAVFRSMLEGTAALATQLQLYAARGTNTVASIIAKYAPANENNTQAYISFLSKKMGVGPDQPLDLKNIEILRGMMAGITNMEVGPGRVSADQINAGIALAQSRAGRGGGSSSSEVNIGSMTVNTRATDAAGIARDLGGELSQYTFVAEAGTGLY